MLNQSKQLAAGKSDICQSISNHLSIYTRYICFYYLVYSLYLSVSSVSTESRWGWGAISSIDQFPPTVWLWLHINISTFYSIHRIQPCQVKTSKNIDTATGTVLHFLSVLIHWTLNYADWGYLNQWIFQKSNNWVLCPCIKLVWPQRATACTDISGRVQYRQYYNQPHSRTALAICRVIPQYNIFNISI